MIGLTEQRGVWTEVVRFGDVWGKIHITRVLFQPTVNLLAWSCRTRMATPVVYCNGICMHMFRSGVRVCILDVVGIQECILRDFPVDLVFELAAADIHQLIELESFENAIDFFT